MIIPQLLVQLIHSAMHRFVKDEFLLLTPITRRRLYHPLRDVSPFTVYFAVQSIIFLRKEQERKGRTLTGQTFIII